jgi:cytochrome c oxidase assembly protein subunit 15
MRSRLSISPERYTQIALAALVLLTLIVFSGAAVRLTGSGLGCEEWPKCSDERIAPLDTHGLIEFVNRVFSALVALSALAAGLLAYFRVPFRRDLMWLGLMLPLGVLGQGVLGGLTVIYDLKPGFVMSHYGLSMLILIAAWALWWRSRPQWEERRAAPGLPPVDRATLWTARVLLPIGALAVFAGTAATASGPHAGGAGTGDVIARLDVKGAGTLDWAIHQHGYVAATLGAAALIALATALLRHAPRGLVLALGTVLALLAVQGAVGAIQYALELPAEIVWLHVCLATCTWIALLWTWSAAGEPAEEQAAARAGAPLGAPTG